MSLKRTWLILGFVLALLLPTGLILKNQNPWTCFAYTEDEMFYAQATMNWVEGRGYRTSQQTEPFDPTITAGIPLAWGTSVVRNVSGAEIPLAGRIFVYATFLLFLLQIARNAFLGRYWMAVPLALGIFGYGLSKIPGGGYFVFGFLGEAPAFLLGALAYASLDRRRSVLAGLFAAATFLMKPTFLFFPAAVALATLLRDRRGALKVVLSSGVGVAGGLCAMATARGQSILDYLRLFYETSRRISSAAPAGNLFDFYAGDASILLGLSGVLAGLALLFVVYGRRRWRASLGASTLFFVLAAAYFLAVGRQPVSKQWAAILTLALAGAAPVWANAVAAHLAGWIPREQIRSVTLAVIATWALSVGQLALHAYKRAPDDACGAKEQMEINRVIRGLADAGTVRYENFGVVVRDLPYSTMMYKLRWTPKIALTRPAAGERLPEWLAGQSSALFPLLEGCESYWKGESFSIFRCGSKAPPTRD